MECALFAEKKILAADDSAHSFSSLSVSFKVPVKIIRSFHISNDRILESTPRPLGSDPSYSRISDLFGPGATDLSCSMIRGDSIILTFDVPPLASGKELCDIDRV